MRVSVGFTRFRAVVLVASSLLVSQRCAGGQPTQTATTPGDAYYYNGGDKIPITISLSEIGVVIRAQADRDRVLELARTLNLKFVRTYTNNITVFALPRELPRADIVKLARDVAARGAKGVRYAGIVATPKAAEAPLIISDEFIANFRPEVSDQQIEALNRENNVQVVRPDRFVQRQYLLRVTDRSTIDALDMANKYYDSGLTTFAYPNFAMVDVYYQAPFIPNDPLFPDQWHHQNTGQNAGTADADADLPLAWAITKGAPGTVIAVIDNKGFDIAHEDLSPNLWVNSGEIPGNGMDDDGNVFVDDVNGWDFTDDDGIPMPGASGDNHGTAVAGVAGARGNNGVGVSGACPECRLMLIRGGTTPQDKADAFEYARSKGAAIISNSWAYAAGSTPPVGVVNAIQNAATNGRHGLGALVLFAMQNDQFNDCTGGSTGVPGLPAVPNVTAISSATNQDRKTTESGFGDCMSLLAPTFRGYGPGGAESTPFTGTLNIVTTDRMVTAGYNSTVPWSTAPGHDPAYCPSETSNLNYTMCFGGTSAATPLVAGIAGLVLTVKPDLTRLQLVNLLQDTADRIQDSVGAYASATGFSTPASGEATHGWGRVNAFEAVRTVAPASAGGRAGTDIFIRDTRLDWGNTEQPSTTVFEPVRSTLPVESVDIKMDALPFLPSGSGFLAAFEALQSEQPQPAQVNRVHVRLRNRGPISATVTVKLVLAMANTAIPDLPSDFWSAFPGNSTNTAVWHPIACSGQPGSTACSIPGVDYSGPSMAGCPGRTHPATCGTSNDAARIVSFDIPSITFTPGIQRIVLLAVIDSSQDRARPLITTTPMDFKPSVLGPRDNNVSFRLVMMTRPPPPAAPTNLRQIR